MSNFHCFFGNSAAPADNGHLHIDADTDDENNATGLVIINNCKHRIKDIADVLTVFKSSKGDSIDAIGENGVGVKQGCATLSNLSFVLSRNQYCFSLGILALELQKHAGIYLPSFEFTWDPANEDYLDSGLEDFLNKQLRQICKDNKDIKNIMRKYGTDRLVQHFLRMTEDLWSFDKNEHIFSLVIDDLKHGYVLDKEEVDLREGRETRLNNHIQKGFLTQIYEELPKHYLHVAHSFDVQIQSKRVTFAHWQRRLIEMSHFQVFIDKKDSMDSEVLSAYNKKEVPNHEYHPLNIYLGFDAIRCADSTGSKCATIYYYSRSAGRLIKHHRDARGELCLSAGGTQFCQGLTIIVDDREGALPLNPTKQDFAFGESEHGEIWHDNMILWTCAVTKLYYNHHLDNCGGIKGTLTAKVIDKCKKAKTLSASKKQIDSIDKCSFSTFQGISKGWKFIAATSSLVLNNRKSCKVQVGTDVLMRLTKSKAPVQKAPSLASPKKKSKPTSMKMKPVLMRKIPHKRKRAHGEASVIVDDKVMSLNCEVVKELKEALLQADEEKEDLEIEISVQGEQIMELKARLTNVSNERRNLQLEISRRDEMIQELEIASQVKEEVVGADSNLQRENEQLKEKLGKALVTIALQNSTT